MNNILVTGASSGIGAALAVKLAERGTSLALAGRSQQKLEALGIAGATLLPGDLTLGGVAEKTVVSASEALGGLDAVIHCAGIGLIKSSLETTDAEFTKVLNVNTRGTFLVAQASAKLMAAQKKGLFVTIPGILGKAPMKNAAAYCASKYAVTGLIKCFAQEFARSGVRFSLFHFGGVDSPFWDDLGTGFQREKMIPVETAADLILQAIDAPPGLVLSEVVMQPESHQLV
jgi:NAD(P)-dependent dehydrogenase (short-subunit alcohol dehydrogenase family)